MKKLVFAISALLILASCGGSKKVVNQSTALKEPVIVADTISVAKLKEAMKKAEEKKEKEEAVEKVVKEELIKTEEVVEEIITEVFNHSVWDGLLRDFVNPEGNVNYEGFRQNRGVLRDYIASLGANMPTENWTQEDQLAYWMNAYNAMTVDLILRNLPLKSIKDIDKPWNQRLWKLGSKWYNLDEIEHQILRKMDDPRIHFGINCASFSCPPLLNEAFTSTRVDGQLDALARSFINDPLRNTIASDRIVISKIFTWFAKDFKKDGSLIDFLNKYSETPIEAKARKSFKEYNWDLNN